MALDDLFLPDIESEVSSVTLIIINMVYVSSCVTPHTQEDSTSSDPENGRYAYNRNIDLILNVV